MKKGVVVFLHIGYWTLYSLLLFLIYALVIAGMQNNLEKPGKIGVRYAEQDTGLKIQTIAPGGPADKQGELKPGDEILKITEGTGGKLIDVTRLAKKDGTRLVVGKKGTVIHLTIKKSNGSLKQISIIREEIEGEQMGPTLVGWFLMMLGLAIVPGLIAFYSFYAFLFNRFLSKRKIALFICVGLFIPILTVIPGELISYFVLENAQWILNVYLSVGAVIAINALLNGVLGLVMRGFISWYGDIKMKEDLNRKNYETELALIKSQINPHFLFNTINNIDVLILKDPPVASDYLNKLSDIMRFMLYETKTEKIPLTKELEYITKYIELQKIRTSNPNYISYKVEGDPDGIFIEPMLFIPFIENAFKHSENKKVENAINLKIRIEQDKLFFNCENNYALNSQTEPQYGGLGNELITKRLQLLYPDKHTFEIINKDGIYKVNLILFR